MARLDHGLERSANTTFQRSVAFGIRERGPVIASQRFPVFGVERSARAIAKQKPHEQKSSGKW